MGSLADVDEHDNIGYRHKQTLQALSHEQHPYYVLLEKFAVAGVIPATVTGLRGEPYSATEGNDLFVGEVSPCANGQLVQREVPKPFAVQAYDRVPDRHAHPFHLSLAPLVNGQAQQGGSATGKIPHLLHLRGSGHAVFQ
jgi:hypothetical protein